MTANTKQKQGFAPIIIVAILAIVVALGLGGYYLSKQNSPLSAAPAIVKIQVFGTKSAEVSSLLTQVLTGKTVNNSKSTDGYEFFTKNIEISNKEDNSWINLNITVLPYTSGAKFTEEYEGSTWVRDLDKEMTWLNTLSQGKQLSAIYNGIGDHKAEVTSKKLGDKQAAIYDTYFKPGATWNHNYALYDGSNSQIVYIALGYVSSYDGSTEDNVTYTVSADNSYFTNVVYPTKVQVLLDSLEAEISKQGEGRP